MKYSSFDKVARPVEHERAGLYLKKSVPATYEELNVMSAKPYVNYYSNAMFPMLPYTNTSDMIHFGRLNKVDFIVIDERYLNKWDSYNELMEMHKHTDEVELFYEDNSDKLIRLFKIKKGASSLSYDR